MIRKIARRRGALPNYHDRGPTLGSLPRALQLKSVQSALSDLKRPPERLQSHCNYRLFITYQHLNGMLSQTKLRPNLPERNGQW